MSTHYIASSFLETIKAYLSLNGYDAPDLLAKIHSVKQQHHWRIPKADFLEILALVNHLYPKTAIGFRIGRMLKPEHYGMIGYMGITCSSLGQAMNRYQHYLKLVESTLDTTVEDLGDNRRIRWWQGDSVAKGILGEFSLMVFVNFYQALISRDIAPVLVELPSKPNGDAKIYELLVGCPVRFDAEAVGIVLPKSIYAMKISTSDPYLRHLYDRQATALASEIKDEKAFLRQAKQALRECLQENDSSAECVAKELGLSLRTFYRHLAQNGLRFRSLLADTRYALARTYLQDNHLSSLAEIALMLGYSEQSAFTRAFHTWAGCSPYYYRRTHMTKN